MEQYSEWLSAEEVQLPAKDHIPGHRLLGVLEFDQLELHLWTGPDGTTVGAWFTDRGCWLGVADSGVG